MSDASTPLPFEGDPVVEALGMDPGAGDGAHDADGPTGDRTRDEGPAATPGTDEPTDAAPATQDSAAAETNGLP